MRTVKIYGHLEYDSARSGKEPAAHLSSSLLQVRHKGSRILSSDRDGEFGIVVPVDRNERKTFENPTGLCWCPDAWTALPQQWYLQKLSLKREFRPQACV